MPNPSIFISYRIADTQVEARLLYTDLANHFGENAVFLDKKRLEPGMDWPDELAANVQHCQILLVLIKEKGKWLGANDEGIRRTDDPKDWVRLEIEHALAAGKTIIPLLFNGAGLPSEQALPESLRFLLKKQGRSIATEKWDSDLAPLLATLEKLGLPQKPDAATTTVHPLAEYPLPDDVPDPLDHHPAPYLGLPFFGRTAARLFFGRTREILEFFSLVENPDVRLISLFGHSGVGKSSFLAAGVLPRLETARQPHYARRQKTEGLGKQLTQLRQMPKIAGKPPAYILDQVEEMFTDVLPGEQMNFVEALRAAVREEPQATIVLGFRSDFQLDVSDLLRQVDCRQEDLPLRPLGHVALTEATEGVWRDPVLGKRYALELERGFADFVARNLMHTESGGAAAILQNRLLKLYDQARASRAADGKIRLNIADYEALCQNAVAEEELLDFQILRLREAIGPDAADEKTILKTLDRFVLDKPTAGTLAKSSLPEDPKNLRAALRRVNLLTELPESQAIRLSHDLLAPIVRRRYQQFLVTETERLEMENVRLRLRRVREDLRDVKFMDAWEGLLLASKRNIASREIWPLAFELAFVFLQARKRQEGAYALFLCTKFMDSVGLIRPPFLSSTFPDTHHFHEILDYLRRCDPSLFIHMERRYFPTMIRVEGGTFEMGNVLRDSVYRDEEPIRSITLFDYELAETPTTWQQYGLFCFATESELPNDNSFGRGEHPVINVSWYDAVEYANWLSEARGRHVVYQIDKDKKDPNNHSGYDYLKWSVATDFGSTGFRLPTKSEWEFAARERGKHIRFGNGKDIADAAEMNFNSSESIQTGSFSVVGENRKKTTPVQQFMPNTLGFFDLSGNVWEWCYNWVGTHPGYPNGQEQGAIRLNCGGSWQLSAFYCRTSAYKYGDAPDHRSKDIGFRLASSVQ